jgi:DNA-binding NarL/FixJ family response regulator
MAKNKQQIRVLVADDHAIFRDGLRKLLDSDEELAVVGEASN